MNKRKLRNEIQSPRNKLLYLIYCAPKSSIKDEPGIKAKICKVLGFSSDGLFYYHLDYLTKSGLVEQHRGYIRATKEGKQEFELIEGPAVLAIATIFMGIMFFIWYIMFKLGYQTAEGILGAGFVTIFVGVLFYINAKRNEPKLPSEAHSFLKGLKKNK